MGALFTMLGLFLALPAQINSWFTEAPKARDNLANALFTSRTFAGAWTNRIEGIVDSTDDEMRQWEEQGDLILSINVHRGSGEGEIYSRGLEQHHIYSRTMFDGVTVNGVFFGTVFDIIGGRRVNLARFALTPSGDKMLFRAGRQTMGYLPAQSTLHRDDTAMSDDVGGPTPAYQNMIERVIDRARRENAAEPPAAPENRAR